MPEITRAEFEARISRLDAAVERGFDQVLGRLDQLNGRVRDTEQRVAVLEDRDGRDLQAARMSAARWGGGIAAIIAGIVSFFTGGR